MLNDNAKLWVKALRSNNHKQIRGKLEANGGHCCLGVLCKVYEKGTGNELGRKEDGGIIGFDLDSHKQVIHWAKLSSDTGEYNINDEECDLVADNDTHNLTFSQIADIIESEPEGLFIDN